MDSALHGSRRHFREWLCGEIVWNSTLSRLPCHSSNGVQDPLSVSIPASLRANDAGQPDKVGYNYNGAGDYADTGQSLGDSVSVGVALGDLDGDGDLDAFVANGGANKVWLNVTDLYPPNIVVSSPENKTYSVDSVPLNFTVDETTSWMGCSLDGQANNTIMGNTTLTSLLDGSHYVVVYANDTAGNMACMHGTSGTAPYRIFPTQPT